MDQNISQFIFATFKEAFEFMRPNLSNYQEFSKALSKQVKIKENDNIQYSFDIELDKLIKDKIEEFGISGKIFSEESGFYEWGEKKYRVVCDPFCNSSLMSRTFQEAAVGISIFSYDYGFITSAIMDFQTGILGMVEDGKTKFYQIQSGEELFFNFSKNEALENSWAVATLENREERKHLDRVSGMMEKTKRIIISSGHIYWLKLAMGVIDVYVDPIGGEKLYEMFACAVAQKSGCIVTDLTGKIFDPSESLKIFENDQNFIYCPVAATNEILHREVLECVK
jgi:fructose-1,6-bisphosphatase/inositol monophosphatase family enzyme